ncbi:tetratricopeptide repeat protein [Phenylobacterium sp.]|jgi:tetratricopeptide (TPR) repeat protein|uniref:tetratricopeptide repeat protein n=1 Tax=Phenylobacterium sp. TaxID=1871053 RepID=UPI002E2EAE61|nr:tetratricopeptide repeat protein [Phenylobacterium sp.]HEX2558872.1 tetratricopeptide repeat protein [Phenylobacterium sp.]
MRFSLLAAVAPLVLLAACATPTPETEVSVTPAPLGTAPTPGASPYGLFLAGQAALNDGRSREAAGFFDRASAEGADDQMVRERAFNAAVLAGDLKKALSLEPTGEDVSEAVKRLARLTRTVDSLAAGDAKTARAQLAEGIGFPHRAAGALLAPWAAAMAGDTEASLVQPDVRGDQVVDFFGRLGQARLFERARRHEEAEAAYKALTDGTFPGEMILLAHGEFLERRGRRADAVALYDKALGEEPDAAGIRMARARAAAGKGAPKAPTLKQGAAESLLAPAAGMLAQKQDQLALVYLRMVLHLDPERDEAWLLVGDVLAGAGDLEGARAAYSRPKPGSLSYVAAQSKLAWSHQQAEDSVRAIELARAAAASGQEDALLTLADLLRANDQHQEAVEVLSGLIAKNPTDWRLLYARGVSYERLKDWPKAEADLMAALKVEPDDPELLNYLGYSWIDRGERLNEALAMVEKAVAANPKSGAMVDSLGWAYYRLGDYKKAVEKLEQAVELEAGDPEINNHLGDAYWRVGRRDEAMFQWRRVLTLDPEARIKADAEAKLASGLGPDGPAATPKVAQP